MCGYQCQSNGLLSTDVSRTIQVRNNIVYSLSKAVFVSLMKRSDIQLAGAKDVKIELDIVKSAIKEGRVPSLFAKYEERSTNKCD